MQTDIIFLIFRMYTITLKETQQIMTALVCGAGQNITLQIFTAVLAVNCRHFHFKVGIILGPYNSSTLEFF